MTAAILLSSWQLVRSLRAARGHRVKPLTVVKNDDGQVCSTPLEVACVLRQDFIQEFSGNVDIVANEMAVCTSDVHESEVRGL